MMKKLDQRGMAALEFCFVAVPLFVLMFTIIDLGRYAITAAVIEYARQYRRAENDDRVLHTPAAIASTSPSGCTDINTYFPSTDRPNAAPFLYGTTSPVPTLSATSASSALTVTGICKFHPRWCRYGVQH